MKKLNLIWSIAFILLLSLAIFAYPSNNPYKDFICSQNLSNLSEIMVITTNMSRTSEGKYTNSMFPAFDENSKLTMEKLNPNTDLSVGDIIEFKVHEYFGCINIHRIIKIKEDKQGIYYVTKGDNNLLPDFQKTRRDNILYKMRT